MRPALRAILTGNVGADATTMRPVREGSGGAASDDAGDKGQAARGDVLAYLVLVSGPRPGGTAYALTHHGALIGTAETADVRIMDPSLDPIHARIICDHVGFAVEDLESAGGTFLGGRRITRAYLADGDRLTLGSSEVAFFLSDRSSERVHDDAGPGARSTALALRDAHSRQFPPRAQRLELPPPRAGDEPHEFTSLDLARRVLAVYRFVRDHRWVFAIFMTLGVFVGVASVFLYPAARTAVSSVTLWPESEVNPVERDRQGPADPAFGFFYAAERAFVNPTLVKSTLEKRHLPADDLEVERVANRLKLENVAGHEYQATFTPGASDPGHDDPVGFLRDHMTNYLDTEIAKKVKVIVAEVDFLRSQVDNLDKDLAAVSSKAVEFREQHVDKLPEQTPLTPETRAQLETRRVELSGLTHRLEGQLEATRRRLGRGAPLVHDKVQVHRTSIRDLDRRLSELKAQGLAEGHPDVKKLQEQKRGLEGLIEQELKTQASSADELSNVEYEGLRSEADQLQSSLRAAQAELADVRGILGQFRRISQDMPAVSARLEEFSQNEDALKRLHAQLFDRLKKAELQLELERVSAASRYEIAVAPRLERTGMKRVIALRGGLGFLGGGLLALA